MAFTPFMCFRSCAAGASAEDLEGMDEREQLRRERRREVFLGDTLWLYSLLFHSRLLLMLYFVPSPMYLYYCVIHEIVLLFMV